MTSSDVWDEAAAQRHDDTASSMFSSEVLDPTVDLLANLTRCGRALEFAIGAGRVAVPLSARGVPVAGIELSASMVAHLRRRVDADAAPVVVGDMATATVPGEFAPLPGQVAVPFDVSDGHLGFDTYDLVTQQATSHHVWTGADGSTRRGTPHFRYVWPAELDLMAQLAGLELESRVADWQCSPFTAESTSHVCVWRKP